ncbi:MAG: alpha/beta hydrolase-fold protein [Patescibacteria group bacterium]
MLRNVEGYAELTVSMPVHGLSRDVTIPYVMGSQANERSDDPSILMFMGMGEEHRAAATSATRTLETCGLPTASFMLPFKGFTPEELPWLVREAPVLIAKELDSRHSDSKTRAIAGNSRGGGIALIAAGEAPELFSAAAALSPAAVANRYLGETTGKRRQALIRDLGIKNPFLQLPSLANTRAALYTGSEIWGHRKAGTLTEALDYALSDGLATLAAYGIAAMIAANKPVKVFAAARDPLFRTNYLRDAIGLDFSHLIEVIPGAHATVASRLGRKQLAIMGRWLASRVLSPAA